MRHYQCTQTSVEFGGTKTVQKILSSHQGTEFNENKRGHRNVAAGLQSDKLKQCMHQMLTALHTSLNNMCYG